ncbi:PRC-barrel domain-containing protein [Parvularcula oceani]|uniref:PRC-barrel domain-containing protein n=1 Tax=Parvularcula oceani TaxID=1247963 RepID=UPI0004E19CCA|nr:PRC-barrel domain-containing protein [Parvularcula oceani]
MKSLLLSGVAATAFALVPAAAQSVDETPRTIPSEATTQDQATDDILDLDRETETDIRTQDDMTTMPADTAAVVQEDEVLTETDDPLYAEEEDTDPLALEGDTELAQEPLEDEDMQVAQEPMESEEAVLAEGSEEDMSAEDLNEQELAQAEEEMQDRAVMSEERMAQDEDMAAPMQDDEYASDSMMEDDSYAMAEDDMSMETASTASDWLLATDFLNAGLNGADGEQVARIEDVLVDADGKAKSVIVASGGLFGVGADQYAVDYDRVEASWEGEELTLGSDLTTDELEAMEPFDLQTAQQEMGSVTLASDLRGSDLVIGQSDESASVEDIAMAKDGSIEALVVAYDGTDYVAPFADLGVAEGDGGFYLDLEPTEISTLERYEGRDAMMSEPMMDEPMMDDPMMEDPMVEEPIMEEEPMMEDEPMDSYED